MENLEKIYIRNKDDISEIFFYFYNWLKLNFNTCLIISENSSLRSNIILELTNRKKLVVSELNSCEAIFRLTCEGKECTTSGGTTVTSDDATYEGAASSAASNGDTANRENTNASSTGCDSKGNQGTVEALEREELKYFLKEYLTSNKKIDDNFYKRVENEMAIEKGFSKNKVGYMDFLLFCIFKKNKVEKIGDANKYININSWFLKNNFPIRKEEMNSFTRTNFIQQIVEDDLKKKKHTYIITRFPPEPNGYLHLGHAKSICLNFGLTEKYGGQTHLRFDDTNPTTEEVQYIESIKEDVKWLGFDWHDHLYFASDYFDQLYEWAVQLIKQGDAYVDDQSIEEIRKNRGNLKEPGVNSPNRDRSVEENLQLFEKMKLGEFKEGEKVLRAKIDMSSGNINLRDPILYRIIHKIHPKSKNKWVIYPMYDFAHGQSDSIEKITHSICTLEFETHRPLYEWFQQKLQIYRTRQIEFARLNVTYMVMSKRKLLTLVNEKYVNGWNDPRMPTISGMRRRGYSPDAIKDFCNKVGVAKRENMISHDLLELCAREDMNKKAIRLFGILKPLKVVITNFQEKLDDTNFDLHDLIALNHPKNESMGQRKIKFEKEIFIDEEDFQENPSDLFYRLAPNRTVRLRYAFCITCNEVVKDETNNHILELRCTYEPESKSGVNNNNYNTLDYSKKVKCSTIHWVAKSNAIPAEFRMYDKLFTKPNPESNDDNDGIVEKNTNDDNTIVFDSKNSTMMEDVVENSNVYDNYITYTTTCAKEDEENSKEDKLIKEEQNNNAGWRKYINKKSLEIYKGVVENYAINCKVGDPIQFERVGFFTKDMDSTQESPVFNLTVALVDNTTLKKKKEDLLKKEMDKLKREKIASERRMKREERKLREKKKLEQAAS
ncbi:glutamine--tRNA ligase [Plasmodium gonderi]|uniref:glutamine--tRNA ligase n=1 Tax=Plasmodium gonderi TaxID=77519 RepID=A0A1Y1JIB1_PLAGO|nr:glutamine--tRNA ligase [Plasmodium gonderi]GAW82249.1 glutamine--tRNA ligase [Plasmodium gonderi]